ncbi:TetR/AcrR family transcriptional regulator [Paenibacillus sp. P26]|nr:TetR/AcrR family transcriptional regulator [Paenibacillus sp. P26]UUZ90013.1 TetR/AcrR family transcriptional regulator [Paenibacillus sp. P25]
MGPMTESKRHEDRRTRRTRQLLRQAFMETMRDKGFAAMTIQDITERADVNRGTFYIHYEDKYRLFDEVVRENFRNLLSDALPPEAGWDGVALKRLILTVLDCFGKKYRHRLPASRFPAEILERAIHEELTVFLGRLLKDHDAPKGVPPEAASRVISWAIFGPAVQWSREPAAVSAEQMADAIYRVIAAGADLQSLE